MKLAARAAMLINIKEDRIVIVDLGNVADRESWIPPVEVMGRQAPVAAPSVVIV